MRAVSFLLLLVLVLGLLNFFTNGAVINAIFDTLNSDQGQTVANSASCLFGIFLVHPIHEFDIFGYPVILPLPSADDIIFSIVLAGFVLFILRALFNIEPDFKHVIITAFAAYIFIKAVGWILIILAGPSCVEVTLTSSELFAPFYSLLMVIGIPFLAWFLLRTFVFKTG